MRRIWRVMVRRTSSFHSQTFATKFSRPRSWRVTPCPQLALDDDLRGDAGVVGARHPQRVVAAHPVVAVNESMMVWLKAWPMCSGAGHVGRRQLDVEP